MKGAQAASPHLFMTYCFPPLHPPSNAVAIPKRETAAPPSWTIRYRRLTKESGWETETIGSHDDYNGAIRILKLNHTELDSKIGKLQHIVAKDTALLLTSVCKGWFACLRLILSPPLNASINLLCVRLIRRLKLLHVERYSRSSVVARHYSRSHLTLSALWDFTS